MALPRRVGRPQVNAGESVGITYPVKLSANILEELRRRKEEDGVPVATRIRRLVERGLSDSPDVFLDEKPPVPLLGRACCGNGCEVVPLPPGVQVVPPFNVPEGSYALFADGDSLEGANPRTAIKNGSIVFFQPTSYPAPGSIVHVEWDEGGREYATLKKLIEKSDGTFELEPLNKAHEKLTPRDNSWTIRGVHVRTLAPTEEDAEIARARRMRAQSEGEIREKKRRDNDKA